MEGVNKSRWGGRAFGWGESAAGWCSRSNWVWGVGSCAAIASEVMDGPKGLDAGLGRSPMATGCVATLAGCGACCRGWPAGGMARGRGRRVFGRSIFTIVVASVYCCCNFSHCGAVKAMAWGSFSIPGFVVGMSGSMM